MKQILFFLFLFSSFIISAQNLTIPQLLELRKKDLGEVEEYLTNKGWEFVEAKEKSEGFMGHAIFKFKPFEDSSSAESFLTYTYDSIYIRISIQTAIKEKYIGYLNTIKSYGCDLISSEIEDGKIVKAYQGATTTFELKTSTATNFYDYKKTLWILNIYSNEDYNFMKY